MRVTTLLSKLSVFLFFIFYALNVLAIDISGTVNSYVKGDGDVASGSTSITHTGSFRGAGSSISIGDTLLLIQSQGATINSTNTDRYGDGVGSGADISTTPTSEHGTDGYAGGLIAQTAGSYEYVEVQSISGLTITLTAGLSNSYTDANEANWQIIIVPDYLAAGARLTGTLTGIAWDGDTGGVIAFNASGGTIDLNNQIIEASAMGFRGGVELEVLTTTNTSSAVVDSAGTDGGKGEGIAGTPKRVYDGNSIVDEGSTTLAGGDFGRGAPANAGGGGGPHNSGGGGGSNAGKGGSGAQGWVGGTTVHFGGYGGQAIFAGANMGGGGGSGEANNSTMAHGGVGGGVIMVRADTATGSGTINAKGGEALDATASGSADGAGGGGGGGSIIMYFATPPNLSGVNVDVSGGMGGDGDPDHGGGGGGGGGIVSIKADVGGVNTLGGAKGANQGADAAAVPSQAGGNGQTNVGSNAFVTLNTDYGDAPNSYGTVSGGIGVYHSFRDNNFDGEIGVSETLLLGAIIDGEGGGNPSAGADSDDLSAQDDEDGITNLADIDPNATNYSIGSSDIFITNQLGETATLHAWLDFDKNGTFDADEYTSITVADGLINQNPASELSWSSVPGLSSVSPGSTTYLRFRLTTDTSITSASATGAANNGEVEDYAITVVDFTPSILTIARSNPADAVTNADELIFSVNFSESVQNIATADFSVSGAGAAASTISAVAGSGSAYTVTVDVDNAANGEVDLNIVAVTGIQDLTGNDLSSISPTGSEETYTLDNTLPTVEIQNAPANSSAAFTATFEFSEEVTGFEIGDISLNNATSSNFVAVDGNTYTALISPTASPVTIDVAQDVATDLIGNGNSAATQISLTAVPVITSSPPAQIKINEMLNYKFQGSDADGDLLTWTITSSPAEISQSDSTIVSTLAGKVDVSGDQDETGTNAEFAGIYGFDIDGQGNIYVTDWPNDKIKKITQEGVVTTIAGSGASAGSPNSNPLLASFNSPKDLAVSPTGDLYVADSGAHVIFKIDGLTGSVSVFAGQLDTSGNTNGDKQSTATFRGPTSVDVDSDGNVYVADRDNQCIRKITISTGVVSTLAGACDQTKETVNSGDGTGAAAKFDNPVGLSVDSSGNVFVVETGDGPSGSNSYGVIRKITPAGEVTTIAGSRTSNTVFSHPYDIFVDNFDNIYVSNYDKHNILKIEPNNTISVVTGTGVQGQLNDGVNSTFDRPLGIAADANGFIYVSDYYNYILRKIELGSRAVGSFPSAGTVQITIRANDGTHTADQTFDLVVYDATTDSDNDGVPNEVEISEGTDSFDNADFLDTDGDGSPNYIDTDDDGDGVSDTQEATDGTDPLNPLIFKDTDNDWVSDAQETADGTDKNDAASFKDDNNNGVPDSLQVHVCLADSFNASTLDTSWSVLAGTPEIVPVSGQSRLRVTNIASGQLGVVSKDFKVSAQRYLIFDFESAAHGGITAGGSEQGADGVAVILSDYSANGGATPTAGQAGGYLGYMSDGSNSGFSGGWLGIGITEYQFFTGNVGNNGITIRGSGSGTTGYNVIQTVTGLTPTIGGSAIGSRYRMVVDSANGINAIVSIMRDSGSGFTNIISNRDVLAAAGQAALPDNLRISFSGSTGASTNNHEFDNLRVLSPNCGSIFTNISVFNPVLSSDGEQTTFQVQLSRPAPAGGVTVDYTTVDGTALNGSEYTATSGTLSFAEGEQSKTIIVTMTSLTSADNGKDFTLSLSNQTNDGNTFIANGNSTITLDAIDSVAPTLTIQGVPANSNAAFTATFEFSEDVTGFAIGDITLVNATASTFASVDDNTYTALITPTGAAVTIDVANNVAIDAASNGNTAATQATSAYDGVAPTVAIQNVPVNSNAAFTATFEFSEDVTGFALGDITLVNATASSFASVDDNTYTALITPTGAAVTIDVANNVAIDAASNGNTAATQAASAYDGVAPTVAIQNVPANTNGAFTATFEFSEDVTGFGLGDVTLGNASISAFATVDANTYTALITPTGASGSVVTIDVASDVANDVANNGNTAASQVASTYDVVAPTVSIQNVPANINAAFTATFEFSENVTGFIAGDITLGNASISNFAAIDGNTYTALVTPTGASGTSVTIDVASAIAIDAAGNDNTAATQATSAYDAVAPTVAIQNVPANTNAAFTATFEFSENVTGFVAGDITLSNALVSNFAAIDGNTYTALITPTGASGTSVTIDVANAVAIDVASNDNTAATQATSAYDVVAPTVSIQNVPANTNAAFTATFEFSENVTGFAVGDITVGNASASNFTAVDGNTYTALITPTGASGTTVTVDVANAVAIDIASNDNSAASQVTSAYDVAAPTVSIQNVPANSNAAFTATFEFSENVTGFAVGDITLGNASVSNFTAVDGNTYTALITPTGASGTSITIDVASAVAIDIANNDNSAASQVTSSYDVVVPTVAIQNVPANTNGAFTATFEFSEDVTGFGLGDITLANATASAFNSVDSNTYTALITPTGASGTTVTVDVANAVATDAASNDNTAAAQVTSAYDTVSPTVAIQNVPANTNAAFTATFEFSENVTGFVAGDITLGNASISNFTAVDGNTYTALITPTGASGTTLTIDIANSVAVDAASNSSTLATQVSSVYDSVIPTVTIQNIPANSNAAFTATFEFSENVTGFAVGDITLGNASVSNFTAVDGNTYTALITPTGASGTSITIDVANAVAIDIASNDNSAAAQVTSVYDVVAPTVAIQNVPANTNAAFTATFEFSENVTGFVAGDITLANASVSNFTAVDGNTYTALITPTGASGTTVTLDVANAVATDIASNDNTAAAQVTSAYDVVAPTVAIQNVPANTNAAFTATFEFSENVTGFIAGDITLDNASISNFTAVDGNTYTALITPTGASGTTVTVDISDAVAIDIASNGNTAAIQATSIYDIAVPTVAIQNVPANSNAAFTATFEFSENVTGFVVGDITLANASISNFTVVDGNTYTALITPTGASGSDVTIDVVAAVATDIASNDNTAAVQVTSAYDVVAPTVAIQNVPANSNAAFTATFEFSEEVTGFTIADIGLGNASASNFTAIDGNTYTALITPTGASGSTVTVDVASTVAIDVASNANTAATQVTSAFDNAEPTVEVLNAPATINNTAAYTLTAQFSEAVSAFIAADISVINAAVSNFIAVDSDTYTFDVTPDGMGNIVVNIAANIALDSAGNQNTAATQVTTVLDTDGDGIDDQTEGTEDADNDGIPNYLDNSADEDGDGIPDIIEGLVDTDNDGIIDAKDIDSDNDGLLDETEVGLSGLDSDNDGIDDVFDVDVTGGLDANNDGIDDDFLGRDTDGNGIPDQVSTDSDNDGISDTLESGATGTDTDNDGIDDAFDIDQTGGPDTNSDGIDDTVLLIDSDGDRTPDYIDTDSDNDGIPDSTEGVADSDNDGMPDYQDTDSDGDGIADNDEGAGDVDNDSTPDYLDTDTDGDGILDADEGTVDTDGDGIANFKDTDSDNDGLSDEVEGAVDTDNDGTGNYIDTDSDGDGAADRLESTLDTDNDGTPNYLDLDSDGDGISDQEEGNGDSDGDGLPDALDTDSDGDGISDADEGNSDTDNDGLPDYKDTDSDGDGLGDQLEGNVDTNNDGTPDYKDTDSDGDGILDADEGAGDADGDGIPDSTDTDSDGDGIPDVDEGNGDVDGDGTPDFKDTDTDGDGIPDAEEGGNDLDNDGTPDFKDTDVDGDGILDILEGTRDSDGDGIPDYKDTDSDGDTVADIDEGAGDADGDGTPNYLDDDSDGDGIHDSVEGTNDLDNDGLPNFLDTDSDGDGIGDAGEGTADTDNDGIANLLDTDSDGDGITDETEGAADTDGDGMANYLDTDTDGDGIPDAVEGTGDADNDGLSNYNDVDADGDGIGDALEGVIDTDNDGTANYLDVDSDGDGISDADEGVEDLDGDGILDVVDQDSDGDGIPDSIEGITDTDNDGTPNYRDSDSDGDGIPDSEEGNTDTDNDGTANYLDTDSDADGISDAAEGIADIDGDGTLNYLDTDSDGDGLSDLEEGNGDVDNDGIADYLDTDSDNDGIPDSLEGTVDSDNDGTPDFRDLDSDNDGIPDSAESSVDSDNDGIPDYKDTDSDNDGINDDAEGAGDSDNDGILDYRDTDSDNDGISDNTEGTNDKDNDGILDYLDTSTDEDSDGIPDIVEGTGDADNDGILDFLDSDTDNDGLPDSLEQPSILSGIDTDDDGIDDSYDVDQTGGSDANNDGIDDNILIDSDNDGIPNYLDVDSDNDGIPDLLEAGLSGTDSDNDGIDDRLDVDITGGVDSNGDGIDDTRSAADTDNDGTPDYLDLDSDNDGASDTSESQVTLTSDGTTLVIDDDDGDGIANVFDADFTSGPDLNMDGIDDGIASLDTDSDGVSDYLDLDSDNDGILDVTELGLLDVDKDGAADAGQPISSNLMDTDNDGIPDLRDLDSDGDGNFDVNGSTTGALDADNDGRIDDISDNDGDGISDVIDGEPGQRGTTQDGDEDGVPSQIDRDDDEDGIADSRETDADDDNDGVSNRLDRDSDGDGIPDRFEANRPPLVGIDSDFDGIDDAYDVDVTGGVDADNDGIDDALEETDIDNDGIPDYQDTDTDGDGIPDNIEQMLAAPSGNDTDSDGIDDAYDVDITGGSDANNDGIDDAMLDLRDIDGDGILNFRDTDSDGDGYLDADENGDYNKDGIPDYVQEDAGFKTALDGSGGSFGLMSLFSLFALAFMRIRDRVKKLLLLTLSLVVSTVLLTSNAHAADKGAEKVCKQDSEFNFDYDGCLYVGLGLGLSILEPEENNTGWELLGENGKGYKATIGYRFLPHWYTEFSYADLGEAKIKNLNPAIKGKEGISYKVPSLSLGYYLFSPDEKRWNVFVKGGIASIRNSASASRVPFKKIQTSQFSLGVGAEYQITPHFFARAEIDSYDTDAIQFVVSINTYFGSSKKAAVHRVQEPIPEPIPEPLPVETVVVVPVVAEVIIQDGDQDGVLDDVDACLETPKGVSVNQQGCSIFEIDLEGIQFEVNSSDLTAGSQTILDIVADALTQHVDINLEVQAHTDDRGSKGYNQRLSQSRAESVANYLVSKGVGIERLEAKGYGELKPTATNDTALGRSKNRRVEFVVLEEPEQTEIPEITEKPEMTEE
ncbi:MAG: outer membrane protein OmpA-like peptidoglycan-associated protein [Oleispira sp.]|jgi:outer membrane protein OmpA-like peptidoglycan-associated protein